MFTYGDFVKVKFSKTLEHYVVVDMADFSREGDGSEMVYEVMRVYPLAKASKVANFDEKQMEMVAKAGTKEGRMMIDWLIMERRKRGWLEAPDFLVTANENLRKAKLKEILPQRLDVINYDKLPTIDDCLDALNDLDTLHKMFGDEAFLQLKEVVTDRLKYLVD